MRKIYLTLLIVVATITLKASPDIYTPSLVAPANNVTGVFPDVELDWSPVTGLLGLHYELQLDTTADFTNPVIFSTELTSSQMSLLKFGETYYWKVRAIDNVATSDWSEVRSFTVIPAVLIRRPNENATAVAANVQIIWTDITGVSHINYQIDTTASFDSPMLISTTVINKAPSQTNASSLHFGQKYYIRMRGYHAADTSAWGETRSFTVTNTFLLKNPANAATKISPDVMFEWNKIDGLTKYQIQVSTNPDLVNHEAYNVAPNLLKLAPDTLLFGTTYYWQVAAIHAADTLMSDVRSFTTVDKVSLTAPSNNATNVVLQPTLSWETISGIHGYQLDIAHNAEFTGAFSYNINSGGQNATFKVPVHVLDSANVYYWRVRAISSRDTSDYSDTWSFRSVTLGVEEDTQLKYSARVFPSPAIDRVSIRLRNNFTGNATIEIYDLLGNKRLDANAAFSNGQHKDLILGDLNNGIYMMSVLINGQRSTSKLIIRK